MARYLPSAGYQRMIAVCGMAAIALGMAVGCSEATTETTIEAKPPHTHEASAAATAAGPSEPVPDALAPGEDLFNHNCARCHGMRGSGTDQGPPLVHKIYEPGHHADFAFQQAAARGVRAHHWKFGNMPKIDTVTPSDVEKIIGYVRWLQRNAGIF